MTIEITQHDRRTDEKRPQPQMICISSGFLFAGSSATCSVVLFNYIIRNLMFYVVLVNNFKSNTPVPKAENPYVLVENIRIPVPGQKSVINSYLHMVITLFNLIL